MRIFIIFSLLFFGKLSFAQDLLYITITESVRNMEIEVILPSDEIQITTVEYTPNDDIKVTFHDKMVKYFKDKSMSLSIIIKKELEKWIKNGYEIETSHTFLKNETIHTTFPGRNTVYVLVKEKE